MNHQQIEPATESKQIIREQILRVSKGVFEKYGYRKTTIDDLARALRKGKSSIYYYFDSKEDLFKALLDQEIEQLKEEILDAVGQLQSPMDKIRAYIEVRIIGTKRLLLFYNFQQNRCFSDENAEELRSKYDKLETDLIKEILDEGVRSGDFNIPNTQMTAVSLLSIIKGMELQVSQEELTVIKGKIDDMLPILFFGICGKE